MRKRIMTIFATTMTIAMVFPSIVSAQAVIANPATTETTVTSYYVPIQKLWDNVRTVSVGLEFDGTTAVGNVAISAFAGTSISGTARLERVNANGTLTLLQSWPISSSSTMLAVEERHTVARGHTYRFSISVTATRNGVSETINSEARRALN